MHHHWDGEGNFKKYYVVNDLKLHSLINMLHFVFSN